jgi:hypothetical protein
VPEIGPAIPGVFNTLPAPVREIAPTIPGVFNTLPAPVREIAPTIPEDYATAPASSWINTVTVPAYTAPTYTVPTPPPGVSQIIQGPGGQENPYTYAPTPQTPAATPDADVGPSLAGGESSSILTPGRLLLFAAIGILTGVWLLN